MPVATLTFAIPEEQDEHSYAASATFIVGAIQNFDNRLRQRIKYENKETIDVADARRWLREELGDLIWILG